MPTATTQKSASLSSPDVSEAPETPRDYNCETRIEPPLDTEGNLIPNTVDVVRYVTLTDGTAQEDTLTISAGTVGDTYSVTISEDDPGNPGTPLAGTEVTWEYNQLAGNTAEDIASRLAQILDLDARIWATVETSVITVKGIVAGKGLLIDVSGSSTPANIVAANTVANVVPTENSGTPLHGKYLVSRITFGINEVDREPTVAYTSTWYDAADPASTIPGTSAQGTKTFQELRKALIS